MKCNVGKKERIARVIIGVIALILGFYITPWFYIIALIGFVTAAIGFCPVTHALGINTCKK